MKEAKALPFFVLALLVLGGLVAAESGSGDPSDEARRAYEEHCRDQPQDPDCSDGTPQGPPDGADETGTNETGPSNGTASQEAVSAYCADPEEDHADECQKYEEYEARQAGTEKGQGRGYTKTASFHHLDFAPDFEDNAFYDYTLDGLPVLDEGHYLGSPDEQRWERRGSTLEARWDDDRLRLHDNPTGLLTFKADGDGEGAFLLDFDDNATITRTDEGASLRFGDRQGILIAPDAEWLSNDTVVVDGFLSFHVAEAPVEDGEEARIQNEHAEEVQSAIQERRLGAQVSLRPADASDATDDGLEVETFDDVEVNVTTPAAITQETPLSVVVSADLPEGRTIVIDVDPALFLGPDGQPLPVDAIILAPRYFDVHDDGNRTEVVFGMASDLADILDPTDDGGQPEYWIVEDTDGIQVMVSVPHWSVHEIQIAASALEFVTQPSVLVGIAAGMAGAVVAAVGLFWPRRD